ncbi:chemotaxis protein CheW [Wenzhouxiangella sp. XN79A]|uniref:chemotaxis protein CheW n=1 Tax=Wenzhouxiangella sp. XN79A TaxID=2724193 RepID=UPI00144A7553|nr:chemotaxis protein CheW [Wenzhouxiangella sp. XN79A]NKI35664.1 chemotaxis protein CheW [Wenzhouxiangella sp. XN79A]
MNEAEIRSVLIPITEGELLVPNASIAEVVAYAEPEPFDQGPAWLLGNVLWHGWQVPVVSFGALTEQQEVEPTEQAKLCITKSLVHNDRLPYIALLAQGFPRLVTITESTLSEVPDSSRHIAIAGAAVVGDRQAWVPDLDRIAQLVAHAAYGALPVTR